MLRASLSETSGSDVSRRKGERLQNYLRDRGLPRYVRKVRGSARRAFNFSVRRTHRELNEAPKRILKKVRSLDTVSCAWTTDGRIVCLLEDGRKVTVLHERDVRFASCLAWREQCGRQWALRWLTLCAKFACLV